MMSKEELDDARQQLANYPNILEKVLGSHEALLGEYKQLQEECDNLKAQLSRSVEHHAFVLVLVDGDGYIFHNDFLSAGFQGGSVAARKLNDAIRSSLEKKGLDRCHLMVRVYANLNSLSKILATKKLAGVEKRSLASFVADFNRTYELTEFIDAGELKEAADSKLRALLQQFAGNPQCKHIYLAACHDVGYISDLAKYQGKKERFTLIQSPGLLFHEHFDKLNLSKEELPGVFLPMQLGEYEPRPYDLTPPSGSSPATKKEREHPNYPSTPKAASLSPPSSEDLLTFGASTGSSIVCPFHALGICRHGSNCRNLHVVPIKPDATTEGNAARGPATDKTGASETSNTSRVYELPKQSEVPSGWVALNKNDERLDTWMAQPSSALIARLHALSATRKFCNNYHLTNSCYKDEECPFSHAELPPELLPSLWWIARSLPCRGESRCRNDTCVFGHVCQNPGCPQHAGKPDSKCKKSKEVHAIDHKMASCVPGTANFLSITSPMARITSRDNDKGGPDSDKKGNKEDQGNESNVGKKGNNGKKPSAEWDRCASQ